MEVGRVIEDYRGDMRMSQKELAKAIGVSRRTISKWEACAAYPDIESLLAMGDVFQVPVGDLIYDDIREIECQVAKDSQELRKHCWVMAAALLFSIIIPVWGYLLFRFSLMFSAALFVAGAVVALVAAIRVMLMNKNNRMMRYRDLLYYWDYDYDCDVPVHDRNLSMPNACITAVLSCVMIAGGIVFIACSFL